MKKPDNKKLAVMTAAMIAAELLLIAGILIYRGARKGDDPAGGESAATSEDTDVESTGPPDSDTDPAGGGEGEAMPDTAADDIMAEAGTDMLDIYSLVLQGDFSSGSGYEYHFGRDGGYSGFFDADHPAIENGRYEIVQDNSFDALKIYNEDAASVVKYYLTFNGDGDVVLSVPDTDVQIVLKLMGK